jgi:hypothetical protein
MDITVIDVLGNELISVCRYEDDRGEDCRVVEILEQIEV